MSVQCQILPLVSNKYFHVDFSLWFPAPRNRRDVTSWNFWDMIARCWASLLRTLQCTHYSIDLGWSMHLKLDAVRGSRWKRKHFCHVWLNAWEAVNIKYQQSQKLDCENGSPPFQTLIQGPSGTQWLDFKSLNGSETLKLVVSNSAVDSLPKSPASGDLDRLMICAWSSDQDEVVMEVQACKPLQLFLNLLVESCWLRFFPYPYPLSTEPFATVFLYTLNHSWRSPKQWWTLTNPVGESYWPNLKKKDTVTCISTAMSIKNKVVSMMVGFPALIKCPD